MAADPAPRRASAAPARLRLRWLLVVIAVMVVLTGGWPLVNSLVSNQQPLTTGSTLTIGPSTADSARFTVGPGWALLPAQSNPDQGYLLHRGALQLSVDYVGLVNSGQVPDLWRGLRQLVKVGNPGARLSNPTVLRTAHGTTGVSGTLRSGHLIGMVAAFPAPSKGFAIEMVALGPRTASPVNLRATRLLMRSLRFRAAAR